MGCLFSIVALSMALIGLLGGFQQQDHAVYWNLVIFVVGVWIPSPRLKPAKTQVKYKHYSKTASSSSTEAWDEDEGEEEDEEEEEGTVSSEVVIKVPVEQTRELGVKSA